MSAPVRPFHRRRRSGAAACEAAAAADVRERFSEEKEAKDELLAATDTRIKAILEHRRGTGTVVERRRRLVRRALLVGDIGALLSAYLVARVLLRGSAPLGVGEDNLRQFGWFASTLPLWIVVARVYGLYSRDEEHPDHTTADDLARIFRLSTICTWLSCVSLLGLGLTHPLLTHVTVFWLVATLLIVVARAGARYLSKRRLAYLQNTVIVGAGEVGQLVAQKFLRHPEYGINLVGFVDSDPRKRSAGLEHVSLLGGLDDLKRIVALFDIERVVIAFSNESNEQTLDVMRSIKDFDLHVDIVPRLFEMVGLNVGVHTVEGLPLLGVPALRLSHSSLVVKRGVDIVAALGGLIVLAPLIAILALLIWWDSPGPVLYAGDRIGRGGRRFQLCKFRTMRTELCRGLEYGGSGAEDAFMLIMDNPEMREEFERTHKLAEDPRVTKFGAFLRRASLDELPQLINVLKGDISIVGPRPITADEYDELLLDGTGLSGEPVPSLRGYWKTTHVRPGLTGYWQISGRSQIGYQERVRLDTAYMQNWSLGLDLLIIAKTVRVLVRPGCAY